VDLTKQAHSEGMDLDHAVAMVRDKTRDRYTVPPEDDLTAQTLELLIRASTNVSGIMHWLEDTDRA
jgi:hypothetical protein